MKKNNINYIIIVIFFIVFIFISTINIINYNLSKNIDQILYTDKKIYKINDKGFSYKFKKTQNYKDKDVIIEKTINNDYKIKVKSFYADSYYCSSFSSLLTKDIYLIKNDQYSYILKIFKNNSINFYELYNKIHLKNYACNYDIDFTIKNILKPGDTIYIFDKNVIIKELYIH